MAEEIKDLIPLESQSKLEEAMEFFNSLREIKITNNQEYGNAGDMLIQIKSTINDIEADRKNIVSPFDKKVRAINAHYKLYRDKLENAESVLKRARQAFYAEQEKKRIEEQKKLEAEAEAKRKAAEEKAEAERRKAAEYEAQGRADMAAKAMARAETAESVAVNTVAPIVEKTDAGKGSSMREVFKLIVEDPVTAKRECLNNPVLCDYISLDVKGLERLANTSKGRIQIPGCRIIKEYSEAVRTA